MSKPVLKWAPATPIRAKDNIVSSAAREKNQTCFVPSYESDKKVYMNFLMSNEYMKLWYKERGKYEKNIYSREETIKEESKIKRRVVQRMMTYRRPVRNDFIDALIHKKSGSPQTEQIISIEKMKYRPDCRRMKKSEKKTESQDKSEVQAKDTKDIKGTEKTKETNETKAAKATKASKQTKTNKEAKITKDSKAHKEAEKTVNKDAEEDQECADGGEVMLVCLEPVNDETSKCIDNKDKQ